LLWIDRIHRWTGAFVGLLLAALGLSGTLLLYKDAWLRATVPHAEEALVTDMVTAGAERLLTDDTLQLTSIIFPTDSLGLFRLSFAGDEGGYADQTGNIVVRWTSKWERLELWMFDFHHDLMMGETGSVVSGVLSLIGLGFVVTGVLLWWRTRKTFAFRVLPSRLSRLHILRHHRDIGAVTTPVVFVAMLTGAMLTLRPVADFLLAPFSPPGTIAESLAGPKVKGGPIDRNFDWRTMLQTVRSAYPDAELRTVSIPEREGQLVRVRVRQPDEWLPNGRTVLWFDPADGRLIESRDAHTLPLATRAFNLVYPVHASTVGGIVYKALMTAAGLALTLLGTLAVYAFWGFQSRRVRELAPARIERSRP
jgi:uncharacterized iron-regulated membrane protein